MPQIVFLPHEDICPDGATITAPTGALIIDAAAAGGVELEHACEKSGACTTCHIIIREGFNSLSPAEEHEEDLLDKAWGLTASSRLGCQARVGNQNLVIEIPRYTINLVSESHR